MAKLNPPILEGKIPACVQTIVQEQKHIEVDIPFVMNRSVGYGDISGMMIKFKTIGGIEIGDPFSVTNIDTHENLPSNQSYIDEDKNKIHIENLPENVINKVNIGQYYKVQIAYLDRSNPAVIGYYSSVGIIKVTKKPVISCEKKNGFELYFRGTYDPNPEEPTEKLYSSHFRLRSGYTIVEDGVEKFCPYPEGNEGLIETTPEKVHMDADINYEDYEIKKELNWTYDLPSGVSENARAFAVYFIPTSINLYKDETKVWFHKQTLDPFPLPDPQDPEHPFVLKAENEYDNGYTIVSIEGGTLPSNYTYILWRYNEEEEWVKLNDIFINSSSFEDFTVEQGKQYIYAIQGLPLDGEGKIDEEGTATEKLCAAPMTAQFEDMFLGDKDRQLRIQFNPKVNSYKRTILESKIETIGGKYPIIFRNGNVDYREIGLGGLISYLMDKDNVFKVFAGSPTEAVRQDTNSTTNDQPQNSTSLSDNNRHKERVFREAVLEWLTNGEPKYFRSPTEGNHIVRVMNVSLSPIDTVGRMIYNFTATSYEIADNTMENLTEYRLASWEE